MTRAFPFLSGALAAAGVFLAGVFLYRFAGIIPSAEPTPGFALPEAPTAPPTATPPDVLATVRAEVGKVATETVQKSQQLAVGYTDRKIKETRQVERAEIEKRVLARVLALLTPAAEGGG